ncbi:hypothetical protein V8C34DRAFT_65013 [Trichoderma compactum]
MEFEGIRRVFSSSLLLLVIVRTSKFAWYLVIKTLGGIPPNAFTTDMKLRTSSSLTFILLPALRLVLYLLVRVSCHLFLIHLASHNASSSSTSGSFSSAGLNRLSMIAVPSASAAC